MSMVNEDAEILHNSPDYHFLPALIQRNVLNLFGPNISSRDLYTSRVAAQLQSSIAEELQTTPSPEGFEALSYLIWLQQVVPIVEFQE